MIKFRGIGRLALVKSDEPITTGSVGLPVVFTFNHDWDDLEKHVSFRGSEKDISIELSSDNCVVPWECLTKANSELWIGATGTKPDGTIVVPTVWARAGVIRQGSMPDGTEPSEDTPDWVAQILQAISDLQYKEIGIRSFHAIPDEAELGSTVDSVTLSYVLSRAPELLMLDDEDVTIPSTTGTIQKTGLVLTEDTSWELEATDERGFCAADITFLRFLNSVYYGVAEEPAEINSAFLLDLSNAVLASSNARVIAVDAGEDEYIWYATPSRFGPCTFNVSGLNGGFAKVSTLTHTNASGYEESYDVYRSDYANLGDTSIRIK